MRVDKFLKVSRLVKRRTLAKALCDAGGVKINGKVAKPGTEVALNDVLDLRLPSGSLTVRVVALRDNVSAKAATDLYEKLP